MLSLKRLPELNGTSLKLISNFIYMAFEITKSNLKNKKYMVTTPSNKRIHFGAAGYSDYTKHKDPERKERYLKRHKKREDWNDPNTAGFWAENILWNKPTIKESIKDTEKDHDIDIKFKPRSKKLYLPDKYFKGLSKDDKKKRVSEIKKGVKTESKDPKSYKQWETDKGVKTRPSNYTKAFKKKFKDVKGFDEISEVTGIPKEVLKTVYKRGVSAWRTGHRPGATPEQWGWARVYSFAMKGCTYYSADKDQADKIKKLPKVKAHYKDLKKMCAK